MYNLVASFLSFHGRPRQAGKRLTIHLRKLGTSSEMLPGKEAFVTKRGMLPGVSCHFFKRD